MSLFKKKAETTSDTIRQMQYEFETMRLEWDSMKRAYEKQEQSIPAIVREQLQALARQESISVVTIYRDEEFLTEVHANRVKELKHKKQMLDQAILECNKALAEINGGEE